MLDRDLAAMYGVETKALNQAVKRNAKRFEGDDFMFRLTKDEAKFARSRSQVVTLESSSNKGILEDSVSSRLQFVTMNKGRGSNIKYLPYAFTELQSNRPENKPRRPIGFVQPDEGWEEPGTCHI